MDNDPTCLALAAVFGAVIGAISKTAALNSFLWLLHMKDRKPPVKGKRKRKPRAKRKSPEKDTT